MKKTGSTAEAVKTETRNIAVSEAAGVVVMFILEIGHSSVREPLSVRM